jgi:S-adenosylmethionine synthetase
MSDPRVSCTNAAPALARRTGLRFAEAVCEGHPDRLCDDIARRIVEAAIARDDHALVGVEVAVHRRMVLVDGRIAAGEGDQCVLSPQDVDGIVRAVFRDAGYGATAAGTFEPDPDGLVVSLDICFGPLGPDERAIRHVSDDQAIAVGYACEGARASYRPLEQALANEFAAALQSLRRREPALGLGPDGKVLVVVVGGRTLAGVSISVHHRPGVEWIALTSAVRAACARIADEYVRAGELEPPGDGVDWLVNGAGAFEIGGPLGDNGLSGKKLVAQAYGASVPIGGGAVHGKDPRKVDPRGQALARQLALDEVLSGRAAEATVWLAWRPGDVEPRWRTIAATPPVRRTAGRRPTARRSRARSARTGAGTRSAARDDARGDSTCRAGRRGAADP